MGKDRPQEEKRVWSFAWAWDKWEASQLQLQDSLALSMLGYMACGWKQLIPLPLLTFPEVHSLEDVSSSYAIVLCCLQELGDLLHLLEGHG